MIVSITGVLLALACVGQCQLDPNLLSADLCLKRLDKEQWNTFALPANLRMDRFAIGKDELPFEDGYQRFLVDRIPGVAADNYECGFSQSCSISSLNDNCPQDPLAATVLKSMAHWSNFYQQVTKTMGEAADFIVSQAGSMPATFNPTEAKPPAGFGGARIGLMTAQFVFALMPLFPPLQVAKEAIGVLKDSAGFTQGILGAVPATAAESALAAGFDSFADISRSAGALRKTGRESIERMIREQLNSQNPYSEKGGLIDQIIGGDFAAAIPDFTQEQKNAFTATLAAPAINDLWNKHQVVVVKFSKKLISGVDPCWGDSAFPASAKYCDGQGNAFVLRSVPVKHDDEIGGTNAEDQKRYTVPGFDQLDKFALNNVQAITQAAFNNQIKTDKYFGVPEEDDGAAVQDLINIAKSDRGIQLQDTVFFNLPVCDLDALEVTEKGREVCAKFQNAEWDICIVNWVLHCGCSSVTYGGEDEPWPYKSWRRALCEIEDKGPDEILNPIGP